MRSLAKQHYQSELSQIDWDFAGENGSSGFAGFHWYPARFVPQLPGILISYLSEPGQLVLDPFCGSGTTLVEAFRIGRRAVGIDVNPMGILMTKAKLVEIEEHHLASKIELLLSEVQSLVRGQDLLRVPQEVPRLLPNEQENRNWYHPKTLDELSSIWTVIHHLDDEDFKTVTLASFSAILRYCCSQDKHWGWICDNVRPRQMVYRDAVEKFSSKLYEFRVAFESLRREAVILQDVPVSSQDCHAYLGDCRDLLGTFPSDAFDIVVTSPPYYNMTDYTKAQRLSLLWFGPPVDAIREQEIGARFKRFRNSSLAEYLDGMRSAFELIVDRLKAGGYCCMVLGESSTHRPFMEQFEEMCSEIGLVAQDSMVRRIAKQRSLSPILHDERILIYRK